MDDGYGVNAGSGARRQGHDIGPDEDRLNDADLVPVDMLTFNENSEDIEYEQVFIARRPGGLIYEPLDETPSTPEPADGPISIIRATDSKYRSEANRLKTFEERWLEDYHVHPADLARDGFVHIGPGDKVKCVFCLKSLHHWERNDSVEREHREHYPDCPFVRGKCENVNIPINPAENMKRSFGLKMKSSAPHASQLQMQDFSDRLKSFETWPKQVPVRPDALAQAGLFYTGRGDEVVCFSCEKVFGRWEPGDDPWFEHAKWSPNCAFLHLVKGSEYVAQVKRIVNDDQRGGEEMMIVTNEPVQREINSAASNLNKEHQHAHSSSREQIQSRYSTQESEDSELDAALRSAAVKAICAVYGVPLDRMRRMLEEIKLTRGEHSSAPVKDVCAAYDVPMEKMLDTLQNLHLSKENR